MPSLPSSFDALLEQQDELIASSKGKKRGREGIPSVSGKKGKAGADPKSSENTTKSVRSVEIKKGMVEQVKNDVDDEESDEDVGDMLQHRADLDALKEKDPEFYRYLQSNAATMLGFGDEEEEEEGEDEDEKLEAEEDYNEGNEVKPMRGSSGAVEGGEKEERGRSRRSPPILTYPLAREILSAAFPAAPSLPSIKSLQRSIQAFRAACYMGETAEMMAVLGLDGGGEGGGKSSSKLKKGETVKKDREGKSLESLVAANESGGPGAAPKTLSFTIHSSKVFMKVVIEVLKAAPATITAIAARGEPQQAAPKQSVAGKRGKGGSIPTLTQKVVVSSLPGWPKVHLLARSFLTCLNHLLSTVRDPRLLTFLLRASVGIIPLAAPFPVILRKLLKTLLALWASPPVDSLGVRLVAFLRLRQMAASLPPPNLDFVLKGTYLAFARASRGGMSESTAVSFV